MKISLCLLLLSFSVLAETFVKIPVTVMDTDTDKVILASRINEVFKLTGKNRLIEEVIVNEEGTIPADFDFWELDDQVQELAEKLNKNYELDMGMIPGEYNFLPIKTCYCGKADLAVSIFSQLSDGPYSDQLSIFASKYRNTTYIDEYFQENFESRDEAIEFLNNGSNLFKNWKNVSEAILLLSTYSDSGDDINSTIIPKCL